MEVLESEAFSDNNAHGFTLRGTALSRRGGASLAMYESYDGSAPLSLDTLSALLSDPRLRWLGDPFRQRGRCNDLARRPKDERHHRELRLVGSRAASWP